MDETKRSFEELVNRHFDGELSEAESRRLAQMLVDDPQCARQFSKAAAMHDQIRSLLKLDRIVAAPISPDAFGAASNFGEAAPPSEGLLGRASDDGSSPGIFGPVLPFLGWRAITGVAFGAVVLLVSVVYWQAEQIAMLKDGIANGRPSTGSPIAVERGRLASMLYMATISDITSCRWDPSRSTANFRNGELEPGQSLNLLEGVSEINAVLPGIGTGKFQLEGPVAMLMTNQGIPSLQYGRLAAQVSCENGAFTFETPMGRAVVYGEASLGLGVEANEVELHVFSGEATFEPFWPVAGANGIEVLRVSVTESLRLSAGKNGSLRIHRDSADESRFVTEESMAASRLNVGKEYVDEIVRAKPIAYWRFESDEAGVVRNEMGDDLACRIYGDGVRFRTYEGNRSGDFGSTRRIGYLASEDALGDRIVDQYSVEAWIKPSHLHHGAFFLLIDKPSTQPEFPAGTGMLLELEGPARLRAGRNPTKIRFLHRSPTGYAGGTSCYSSTPYKARCWQHVVCVKQNDEMRLYLDGTIVGRAKNSAALADNLQVFIGQLHPHDSSGNSIVRPFIGELDEVSLYDRAITESEIIRHFELARPSNSSPSDEKKRSVFPEA